MAATARSEAASGAVSVGDIEAAARRIAALRRATPTLRAGEVSRRTGAPVLLKAENLQRTGSFKIRGAANRIARLGERELRRGIVAASAGNHAQAVAVAARTRESAARLFMPAGAPLAKVEAVRGYGGEVRLVEGSYDDAARAAREDAERTGRILVHPFDDADIVAGQGTVGLEIASEAPETRLIAVALGGGALAAGIAIAAKDRLPGVRVVGVQSEACAPYPPSLDATRPGGAGVEAGGAGVEAGGAGVEAGGAGDQRDPGPVSTICDGIAVKQPGELTLPLVAEHVDEVVTVSDDQVAEAMVLLLERSKLVVEPAGAASVAALIAGRIDPPASGEICAVLSGGNVDAGRLVECIRLGETAAGRRLVLTTVIPDRPGALADLLGTVAREDANVIDVAHIREGIDLHVRETAVRLVLQTDGRDHSERIRAAIAAEGFVARVEERV
jgi:threonine dehydratase